MKKTLLLIIALATMPVSSALGAGPAEAADTKKAKELFGDAQKLYKQGRFAEAIEKFELAYQAKPHPLIYFNVGRCYEELAKVGPALKAYKSYLRLSPEAKDRNQVADTIANLERKLRDQGLQQLTVVVDPPAAQIEVDGQGAGPSPATVELTVGNHHVVLTADGYEKIDRTISMTPGQASELNIAMVKSSEPKAPATDAPVAERPKPEPEPESIISAVQPEPSLTEISTEQPAKVSPPRGRVWTYVVGGVAVASLGAAVGMGVGSLLEAEAYRAGDNGQRWPTEGPTGAEGMAHYDAANTLSTGANIAYVVAGAAAITAIVLFFTEAREVQWLRPSPR